VDRRGDESLTPAGKIPDLKGHLPALDGFRGLAMILALLHHFILPLPGLEGRAGLHHLAEAGRIGLDLFFVLSGFLITGILLDTRGGRHYFRNFYIRRTLRIQPLYYLLLAVFLLILPAVYEKSLSTLSRAMIWSAEAREWPWYVAYLSNFLFVQRNGFAHSGLDVTWSLAIEEQFYLTWAVLVYFIGSRRLLTVCVALILGAFVTRTVMLLGGASWIQVHVMTFARMDTLAFGALVAVLMRGPFYAPDRFARVSHVLLAGTLLLFLALMPFGAVRHDSSVTLTVGYTVVGLFAAAGLVALVHAGDDCVAGRFFRSRFLRFFGKYSYAIYLSHVPLRDTLRRTIFPDSLLVGSTGLELIGRQLLFFIACTAFSVGVALVSWNVYEKQWLRLKKYFPRFTPPRNSEASLAPDPSLVSLK
jgi:peptidoglycan/LPS O-acetylase OafA/YrhL